MMAWGQEQNVGLGDGTPGSNQFCLVGGKTLVYSIIK